MLGARIVDRTGSKAAVLLHVGTATHFRIFVVSTLLQLWNLFPLAIEMQDLVYRSSNLLRKLLHGNLALLNGDPHSVLICLYVNTLLYLRIS